MIMTPKFSRHGPFKLQVMSHVPFSAIFHDFLYDSEIDAYIQKASTNLIRSEHATKNGGAESSVLRTSKQVKFMVKFHVLHFGHTRLKLIFSDPNFVSTI